MPIPRRSQPIPLDGPSADLGGRPCPYLGGLPGTSNINLRNSQCIHVRMMDATIEILTLKGKLWQKKNSPVK